MIEIKRAIDILKANLKCNELETSGDFGLCNHDCDNCSLCYEQGTNEEHREALRIAIESLQMINEDDLLNQFKLYTHIYKLMFNVTNVNFLKLISATAIELINDIEEKEKLRVDDTETYKFDDTMKYDE